MRRELVNTTALIAFVVTCGWTGTARAQAAPAVGGGAPPAAPVGIRTKKAVQPAKSSSVQNSALSEQSADQNAIIVTAQKRAERLQDVPVSVTALNAQSLAQQGLVQISDYYSKVPALSLQTNGSGYSLSVRGLNSGGGGKTVGVLIDDVPVYPYSGPPNIDPSDLASIELLRGPQGTLYGSSTIGGILKYVTADPSVRDVYGRIETGFVGVQGGSALGYSARGALNLPVTDAFAVRASAFYRHDPGYIDNVQTGQDDINSANVYGTHVAALWRPSADFSVKLGVLSQVQRTNGGNFETQGFGDLKQDALIGTGWFHKNDLLLSAVVKANIWGIHLISVSGYDKYSETESIDETNTYGDYAEYFTQLEGLPVVRTNVLNNQSHGQIYSQEIRATGTLLKHIDWLLGGFYSSLHGSLYEQLNAVDSTNKNVILKLADVSIPQSIDYNTEKAVFANLTFHFSSRADLQVGGRESWNRSRYHEFDIGLLFDGTSTTDAASRSTSFTFLVTPRFRISDEAMLYARIASGFRPGFGNNNCAFLGVPCQVQPDTTVDYEAGAKGKLLDGKVEYDASAYYIAWKNIQTQVISPTANIGYTANAGAAKSQGLEVSLSAHPLSGLTIGGWFAYSDARLTKAFPISGPTYGLSGDPLPFTSKYSANFGVDQSLRLSDDIKGDLGGDIRYLGHRMGNFVGKDSEGNPAAVRGSYPGYTQVDLHAGLSRGPWAINFFANNVTNKRGIVTAGFDDPRSILHTQPRTVGFNLAKSF